MRHASGRPRGTKASEPNFRRGRDFRGGRDFRSIASLPGAPCASLARPPPRTAPPPGRRSSSQESKGWRGWAAGTAGRGRAEVQSLPPGESVLPLPRSAPGHVARASGISEGSGDPGVHGDLGGPGSRGSWVCEDLRDSRLSWGFGGLGGRGRGRGARWARSELPLKRVCGSQGEPPSHTRKAQREKGRLHAILAREHRHRNFK